MIRQLEKSLALSLRLIKIPKYNCSFHVNQKIKHYAEMQSRSFRRQFLNRSVLNKNKTTIHAELRQPNDSILSLRKFSRCPGVIKSLSGNPDQDIDITLHAPMVHAYRKRVNYFRQTVYVRVDGQQIRCVLSKVEYNSRENFIEQVTFK